MVRHRHTAAHVAPGFAHTLRLAASALLLLATASTQAQNYSTADTVTEYPNKGTYYHDRFEGRKTANGEIFDQNKFTAAHWRIKMGTYVMVTNRNNGKQVIVRVNDRCPKRGVLDMSHRAATAIGILGCQPVTVRILPEGYEERWAAQETLFDSVRSRLYPTVSTPAKPAAVAQTGKTPVFRDSLASGGYNLVLGIVDSHTEAYNVIQRLPAAYRDRVDIESIDGSDSLLLTLNVRFTRQQAEQLARSLKDKMPETSIVPAE